MRAVLLAIVGVLSGATDASADPEATRLFNEGRDLFPHKPDEACRKFAQSLELERAGGTLLNLGECAERKGELVRAWSLYTEAADEYARTGKAAAQKFARQRAVALEAKLATVIVRVAEPDTEGLTVRIGDDEVTPVAKISRFSDPGVLTITARAPGRATFEASVKTVAGKKITVEVPVLGPASGDPARPEVMPPPRRPGGGWRATFWASTGVTVAGAGMWIYGWRLIVDAREHVCTTSSCTMSTPLPMAERERYNAQGRRGAWLSYTGGALVAGATLVAAISLYKGYLRSDPPRARDRTALAIAPLTAPSAFGLALTGGF
jgi:hypothetical protein